MNDLEQIIADLTAALKTIDGVRFYDYGDSIDPPAVLTSPPALNWEGYNSGITSASVQVFLVVGQTDRALPQLLKFVPLVSDAVDGVTNAAVTTAHPTVFADGRTDFPAYAITVEISL